MRPLAVIRWRVPESVDQLPFSLVGAINDPIETASGKPGILQNVLILVSSNPAAGQCPHLVHRVMSLRPYHAVALKAASKFLGNVLISIAYSILNRRVIA
jgi:hypothetical protein